MRRPARAGRDSRVHGSVDQGATSPHCLNQKQAASAHSGFLASHSDFLKVKGIGKVIQGVVKEAPWSTFKPSKTPAPVTLIPAKGLELRCNRLNIFKSDGKKIEEQWDKIEGMGLTVPEVVYDMTRSLAMDLETCSIVGSNGRFLVYAIGFRYMDRKVQPIAQSVEDLRAGLMWRAVQDKEEDGGECRPRRSRSQASVRVRPQREQVLPLMSACSLSKRRR